MDYTDQRVTVMGLGRFGGGVGVTRFLSQRGAIVTVTDTATAEQLADSVAQVGKLPGAGAGVGVSYHLGEHRAEDFREADLVVANPAVKPGNRYLEIAREAGVPVTTEIALLVRELPNRLRTIGVTGSAGKSTTTAMIAHLLCKALEPRGILPGARVHMGGNIGGSLLPAVDEIGEADWVVLELSSFMLQYLREEKWSPHIAVVTNLSANHLDWHGDFEAYREAKRALLAFQQRGDVAVLGESVADWPVGQGVKREVVAAGLAGETAAAMGLKLPGEHNALNAAAARMAVAAAVGAAEMEALAVGGLADFSGLAHRLEDAGAFDSTASLIGKAGVVRCFNDSKATTPEAAILAIEALRQGGDLHIILGGADKGSDFLALCESAAAWCVKAYTIGDTGNEIADGVSANGGGVARCGTLEAAVAEVKRCALPGEVVLLSPGCASWDQFANYEERGAAFVALVGGG